MRMEKHAANKRIRFPELCGSVRLPSKQNRWVWTVALNFARVVMVCTPNLAVCLGSVLTRCSAICSDAPPDVEASCRGHCVRVHECDIFIVFHSKWWQLELRPIPATCDAGFLGESLWFDRPSQIPWQNALQIGNASHTENLHILTAQCCLQIFAHVPGG